MTELRVDSRWWYWAAAVPLVTAFWVVCSVWTFAVVQLVPEAVVSDAGDVLSLPAVALGVPALAAYLVLPLALWMDAHAIDAAGSDWPGDDFPAPGIAVLADVFVVGGSVMLFRGSTLGGLGVVVGAALGSWVAVRYLRDRRHHVAMPASFWEWRDELRAGDRRERADGTRGER
ncbi:MULTISPECIES: hypothetical protein [Halobacterium]|uniref:hypothetical protein n=1 Tax=Halobacterium TaxID=2239 RepID=UPI00073EF7E2|nr:MULTISPECIES: hypothetical protein [Halobacterium]MCG1004329.1 hypothetical protein [Halobacterium noricense]